MKTHDYEKHANSYAKLGISGSFSILFDKLTEIVKEDSKGIKALDYGCGPGRSTRFLNSSGLDAVGVDHNDDMIREANSIDPKGSYNKIQSANLGEYKNETFDVILSNIVFVEFPTKDEMQKVVNEMFRVIKKDGLIMIATILPDAFTRNWNSYIADFPENRNLKSGDKGKILVTDSDIVFYDYMWFDEDYREVFSKAGLKLERFEQPLATEYGDTKWYSETEHPLWTIYVCKKE